MIMRVVLLVLLELVVSCSSVQITPIDVVNYNCQSNRRDIVKVILGMSMSSMITMINYITYYKVQSKKQFNILQLLISSIARIIIENYSFVGIFESRTFLKSVYFHQLMTTTSFGVANNDINNDHPTTISKEKLSNLDADLNKVITTTANTNSDTHSINKISNTIIRFNETNSTFS